MTARRPTVTAAQLADAMKPLVEADIADGQLPAGVAAFSDLHDHVDANEYLTQPLAQLEPADDDYEYTDDELEAERARDNEATSLVDQWLRNGRQ